MNGKCLDIGTIQCFLDGEVSQEESLRIGHHIANCEACAHLLAVAEDENSFVFSTLEREMNALVPTQRLWTRINDTIKVEKSRQPFWRTLFAFFGVSLISPTSASAAALLVVFGLAGAVWLSRTDSGAVVTQNEPDGSVQNPVTPSSSEIASAISPDVAADVEPASGITTPAIKVSNHSPKKLEQLVTAANTEPRPIHLDYRDDRYTPIPGEASYIKTIADLKETVDGRKDAVYTGSSRVAFERDLAVVNDSINRMRKVVKKNPRNQSARQVLYSAYQDKIDLLNSVAQKDELMATVD